ncbi:MAG: hypothetical protein ACLPV8_20315 [Steroidobacteraceae bacterium]
MARERSPNYPAYGLPAALQFARMVWNKEKRTSVSMEVLADALGSESVSGPVRSKVAAMRQYGLLVPANDGLRVSDRAITLLLQHPGEAEYDEAARDAAQSPALFHDLSEERPDASDQALNFHLVRNLKFSVDGAKRVIKSYRETLAFAKLDTGSYTADEVPSEGSEPPPVVGQAAATQKPQTVEGKGHMSFVFALPRGVSAEVIFHGSEPTKRAVEKLRAYLDLFADDLPDDVPPVDALPPVQKQALSDSRSLLAEDDPMKAEIARIEQENRRTLEGR